MNDIHAAIFNEHYRVVSVDNQCLTVQGLRSGNVFTITNSNPDRPINVAKFPVGQRIELSDPTAGPVH